MKYDPGTTPAEQPLLTFAIPTFNRARYLNQLLSVLFDQLRHEPRVELIVSDNASPDETPSVVQSYQDRGLPIRFLRNPENLGADRNILQCFEMATGKYVWVFGDDDVLEPEALAKVLSHLSGEDYDLVYVSSRGFTGDYSPKAAASTKGAVHFTRAEDLACRVHVFFTFISGNIVNKNRVLSLPHRPFTDLAGTQLLQLGWIYTALEHHRSSLLIRDPLVASLMENTGGYALFKVFGPTLQTITDSSLTSDRVKRPILHGALQTFFPFFLLGRRVSHGSFVKEDPHAILKPVFGHSIRYWIFDFPILRMPLPLARLWLWMIRAINRADRMMGNPLLRL